MKYCISVVVIILALMGTIYSSGGVIVTYLDIPSLILSVLLPAILMIVLYGFTDLKMMLRAPFDPKTSRENLFKADAFYKTFSRLSLAAGCIAVLIGVIAMLKNLEDPTAVGPNMAVSLISLFYAGLVNVLVIPLRVMIQKKLDSSYK